MKLQLFTEPLDRAEEAMLKYADEIAAAAEPDRIRNSHAYVCAHLRAEAIRNAVKIGRKAAAS